MVSLPLIGEPDNRTACVLFVFHVLLCSLQKSYSFCFYRSFFRRNVFIVIIVFVVTVVIGGVALVVDGVVVSSESCVMRMGSDNIIVSFIYRGISILIKVDLKLICFVRRLLLMTAYMWHLSFMFICYVVS